jgi:hypothetical protein
VTITLIAVACILAAALLIGQALFHVMGVREWTWLSPSLGLTAMIIVASPAEFIPGKAFTTFIALCVATALSAVVLLRARSMWPDAAGLVAGLPLLALVSLPFAAAGAAGILGKSFNNDMANHLAHVAGLTPGGAPELLVWDALGYPTGPHTLVASLATGTGMSSALVFSAFSMSLPVILGWTALHGLTHRYWWSALPTALIVGGSFLVAAYFAQGSFKETALAISALAMTLLLWKPPSLGRVTRWLPHAAIVAGALAIYSYVGLIWPLLLIAVWGAVRLALAVWRTGSASPIARAARSNAVPATIGLGVGVALTLPILGRIRRFISWEGLPVDNLGNLVGPLPFSQVLGNWNSTDFRVDGPYSSWVTLSSMLFGIAVIVGCVWALRRGEWMPVLAAVVGALVWVWADQTQSPYVASKMLSVLAPIVMFLAIRPAVEAGPGPETRRAPLFWKPVAALGLVIIGVGPSINALRAAPVEPVDRAEEIGQVAATIGPRSALYLGNDDFTPWLFRGTPIASPVIGAPRMDFRVTKPLLYGVAYDSDSLPSGSLGRFEFIVAPRDAASSSIPDAFSLVRRTQRFNVYRRTGRLLPRSVLQGEKGWASGALLDCSTGTGARIKRAGGRAALRPPQVSSPGPALPAGAAGTADLDLTPGSWDLVAAYTAPRPILVSSPGLRTTLPAYLGRPGPRWPIGRVTVGSAGPYEIKFRATRTWASPGNTAIGATPTQILQVTAVRVERLRIVPIAQACGRIIDWYQSERPR